LNEKIKRKAHVKQSFSLDFLERGTFTEYPVVESVKTTLRFLSGTDYTNYMDKFILFPCLFV